MNILTNFDATIFNDTRFNVTSTVTYKCPTSEELSQEMTRAVLPVTILIAVECVFGIIGNIFILIVYSKWYKLCSFRCFVLSLACIDLTSSLTTLPGEIVSQINWYDYRYDTLCKVKSFFNVFTVWSSALVLFLLAYDRYRKICYPLSWQIPVRNSARLCLACIAFSLIISSPIAVLWGIQSYDYVVGNHTIHVSICEKAEIYADDHIPFVYVLCALVTPMFLIMLVTVILNVYTGRKLLPSLRNRNVETNGVKNEMVQCVVCTEDSSQFSTGTHVENKHSDIMHTTNMHRRFSFPAGKWSLRRKVLINKLNHFRLSGLHLHDIPEVSDELTSGECSAHAHLKSHSTPRQRNHFSTSDVSDVDKEHTCMSSWHSQYLVNKLTTRRRKTLIMLILTGVFIFTMSLYLTFVCVVANTEGVLRRLTNSQKVVFFFFWRLYFINSLINPLLYGFMDHRFRKGLKRLFCGKKRYLRTGLY